MTLRVLVSFAFAALMGIACAETSEDGARPQAPSALESVRSIRFALTDGVDSVVDREAAGSADIARKLLVRHLRRAGYRIVDDDSAEANLVLSLSITKRQQFIQVIQNGKVLNGYEVVATLAVAHDSRTIARSERRFDVTVGEMEEDELESMVRELNASKAMAPFAAFMSRLRAKNEQKAAARRDADERRRVAQWTAQYVGSCEEPKTAADCDKLADWVSESHSRDDQPFLDEAQRILNKARPVIAALRDEAAWTASHVATCLQGATEADCASVAMYLSMFPHGSHRGDAQAAMDNLAKRSLERGKQQALAERREVAEAQRQRQAAHEQASAEQAKARQGQQRAACRGGCGNKCATVLEQGAFQSCLSACIATCP